jgi:sugar transferase (PEP-CTERM/EpsH1 system associated)
VVSVRILFLAHRIPYPPDKGEKIRAYHELKFLGGRHSVDLFCFADSRAEAEQERGLRGLCRSIYVETRGKSTVAAGAVRSILRGEPLSCGCFFSHRFKDKIDQALATETYDVIFVFCSIMAQYIPLPAPAPMVMDFVDVDSAKWAQYAERSRLPLSWLFKREARELARYEKKLVCASSSTIVTTVQEARLLHGDEIPPVKVIGNGVELPTARAEGPPPYILALQPYVLFVGTMNYLPNVDAVEYFAKDIFPRVRHRHPELKFVIAGRDPSRRVRRLARQVGIVVTGGVPEVNTYLAGSRAVVAPFRIAQGIQNKLLEALAAGKPVVSSSGPAAAIGAAHGTDLLVADTPAEFASAIVSVLEDPELYFRFNCGPEFVRRNFSWCEKLDKLELLLQRAANPHLRIEQEALDRAEAF